jgi:histidyl-tRNA synthetase
MGEQIKAIRGMKDILPPETMRWQQVEQLAREVFDLYGYQEIRLPVLERTELFTRSIGQETDIVSKEMYTFPDRHGDSLTLRPEATAQVVRAVLENRLEKGAGAKKFYTMGPMFRYERPQKGRYRQFHQINVEALGSDAPELDAEVILMLLDLLGRLGLSQVRLLINSLGCPACTEDFKANLKLFLWQREGWCPDCQHRREANPLRVLDCKSGNCQELLRQAPIMRNYLCPECEQHYFRVLSLLEGTGYEEQPRLVRGLDYYTRTTFEVVAAGLGAQDAVAGGGRYNGLVRELGGPDLPGLGFAIGEERLLEILPLEVGQRRQPRTFIVALGEAARGRGFALLRELRAQGLPSDMDFEGRSLKSQMSLADRWGAAYTLIIGDQELASGQVVVRQMQGGGQESIPAEQLLEYLVERLHNFGIK